MKSWLIGWLLGPLVALAQQAGNASVADSSNRRIPVFDGEVGFCVSSNSTWPSTTTFAR